MQASATEASVSSVGFTRVQAGSSPDVLNVSSAPAPSRLLDHVVPELLALIEKAALAEGAGGLEPTPPVPTTQCYDHAAVAALQAIGMVSSPRDVRSAPGLQAQQATSILNSPTSTPDSELFAACVAVASRFSTPPRGASEQARSAGISSIAPGQLVARTDQTKDASGVAGCALGVATNSMVGDPDATPHGCCSIALCWSTFACLW